MEIKASKVLTSGLSLSIYDMYGLNPENPRDFSKIIKTSVFRLNPWVIGAHNINPWVIGTHNINPWVIGTPNINLWVIGTQH